MNRETRTMRPTPIRLATAVAAAAALALPLLLAAPARAQVERPESIQYPALPEFDIPTPTRVELPNGMVVMLLENHELPLVEATALVRTGERLEPADQVGLADITADVMRTGGTESMSSDELDDYLEGKAASIESGAQVDRGRVSMSSLADDFPDVLRVFADVLRHPAFAPERIQVALTQAQASVARQNDQPQSILFRELREEVYGASSPYARTETYRTLANIDRSDLIAWHRAYYRPDRVILGLVGDFDTEKAVALVREVFGDWTGGPGAPGETKVEFRKQPNPGVFEAEKADMNQSNIALGHLGILRDDPDYYALDVLNELFGASMTSRLFSEVRTKKGLAYAVSGRVGSDWDHPGITLLFTTTKVSTTGEAIQALLDEVRALRDGRPPTEDEVDQAKRSLLSSFVFRVDTPDEVLQQEMTLEYFGYPVDWLTTYRDRIDAVTAEQVRQAAVKHFQPESFSIVVVGPAEGRDMDLSTFGPVTKLDISIEPPPAPEAPAP